MQKTVHRHRVAPQLLAADRTAISEIMTRAPVTVRPELALDDVMTLFLEQNISRAPVVDDSDQLIGMISKTDLLVDAYVRGDTEVDQRGDGGTGSHVHEASNIVRDVMTPVAYSLAATTSIGAAARRMVADNVHAVPVVSETGRVVGILSATDVLAWVAGV
jgi:CBS domain-containing protein